MISKTSHNHILKHKHKAGFSLVEMILSMGLLALLSVLFATLMVFAINMSSNASGRTDDRLNAVGDSEIIYLNDDYTPPAGLSEEEFEITIDGVTDKIKVNRVQVNSGGQSYSAFYYTD
jgi:type II secretory pathway pseudopilin PulG